MAINENLANRLREILGSHPNLAEKKMFSHAAFMLNGKLLASVGDNEVMLRIDPALNDEVLKKPGIRNMIMKGKALKGWVYVKGEELNSKKSLAYWLGLALAFNAKAKASKKSK